MVKMLSVCERYAADFNLQFSTDPLPQKSKTKCLYLCGHLDPVYPAPVQLCGRDLPWVQHATHLGHELHPLCNMEFDANLKRAQFIEASLKIQESFGFAHPREILRAIHSHAAHWYGSMLWDLYGEKVGQICRSWNTTVKVTWEVPRSTRTFLVESLLAPELPTVKQQLTSRYIRFVRNLLSSDSTEVRVVASMMVRCARSTTGKNLLNIERETSLDPLRAQPWQVRLAVGREGFPPNEGWRWHYLKKLLDARREMATNCDNTEDITVLIEGLCNS